MTATFCIWETPTEMAWLTIRTREQIEAEGATTLTTTTSN